MVANTWKFAELKGIIFSLLLVSICFIAINGAPINTTSTEQTNGSNETNEHLSVMMRSYPILKRLKQCFTILNNKDLLSARGACKSFHGFASKLLDGRNKPLIITNGTISDIIDRQIFSSYEETDINDFLKLRSWQPEIALLFDDCNNPTPIQYMPCDCLYFQIIPHNNRFNILLNLPTGGMLGNNHPRSGVIIPKMYDAFIDFIILTNRYEFLPADELKMLHKAKFIIAFGRSVSSPSDIEFDINANIAKHLPENQSVPICYAFYIRYIYEWGASLFLVFSGNNVEASTFLVETTNEEKLREKLLKWKESTESTNSENVFREVFGIHPLTLRLSASDLAETGLIHCNSTTNTTRYPSSVYAIVGYKKFGYITTNLS